MTSSDTCLVNSIEDTSTTRTFDKSPTVAYPSTTNLSPEEDPYTSSSVPLMTESDDHLDSSSGGDLSMNSGSNEGEPQPVLVSPTFRQPRKSKGGNNLSSSSSSGKESETILPLSMSISRLRERPDRSGDASVRSTRSVTSVGSALRSQNPEYQARRDKLLEERRLQRLSAAAASSSSSLVPSSSPVTTPSTTTGRSVGDTSRRRSTRPTPAVSPRKRIGQQPHYSQGHPGSTQETPVVLEPVVIQDITCDEKDPTSPISLARSTPTSSPPGMNIVAPLTNNSTMTESSSKLQGLRASKTERESQLRQLFSDPPRLSVTLGGGGAPPPAKPSLVEPEVYADMKEELVHAYQVIELQKQHLHEARQHRMVASPPFGSESEDPSKSDSTKIAELQETIRQMQEAHGYRELELQNKITHMSREFKATIKHWKRETKCWRQRFESSWEDHQRTIQQLTTEKNELMDRAREAEQEVSNLLRREPHETAPEWVRTKARVQELEALLNLRGENIHPSETTTTTVSSILAKQTNIDNIAPMDMVPADDTTRSETKAQGTSGSKEYTRSMNPPALQASLLEEAMKKPPNPPRSTTRKGLLAGWLQY